MFLVFGNQLTDLNWKFIYGFFCEWRIGWKWANDLAKLKTGYIWSQFIDLLIVIHIGFLRKFLKSWFFKYDTFNRAISNLCFWLNV